MCSVSAPVLMSSSSSSSVKTSGDWMSLFLGSRSGSIRDHGISLPRESSNHSRSTYSPEYSGSSYSRHAIASPPSYRRSPPSYRSSPPSYRRSSYRYLPQYTSRWTEAEDRPRFSAISHTKEEDEEEDDERRTARTGSSASARLQENRSRSSVTVLNEGTIVIKRSGAVDTSDEDTEDEDENEQPPESPQPPPRDPLEVEEEELLNKLQTAGFLMSLPEEEQAKKRLVEIKQMRENPELFRPENSRDWKFSQVFSQISKPSTARAEEEKILLLRLNSRGISDVEQTDVQVRLQEIWRDRREEVEQGVSKLEQEYEHLLSESSTEISELDGSIRGKQATIAKLQEELLIMNLKKEKVAEDMEKVTTNHHEKLETLKSEIKQLEAKSSEFSVVTKKVVESSLPEDERSEIEAELECPVCLEISRPPIYQCGEGHIVCSKCKPLLKCCCQCESRYSDPPIRCRFAEKLAAKYFREDADL